MEPKRKKTHTKAVLQTFWKYTDQHRGLFIFTICGVFIQQAAYVLSPIYLKNFTNALTHPGVATAAITAPLWVYAFLQFMGWVGGRMEMGGGLTMIIRAQEKMSEESFAYLIRHSYHFFSSSFSGALVRKVGRYKDAYERLYYSIQTSVLPAVLYIVGITTVLFLRNVLLGSILLAWVLLFIFAQWILIRRQQPLRHKRVEEDSNLTATLADAIGNQNTIALFAATKYEDARVHDASTRLHTALRKLWHFDLTMYGIQGILSIIIQIGLLWAAFIFQQRGALTVGDIVLIQAYIFGLFNHVWGLGREFRVIYNSVADASEMVEILQTPHEVQDAPNAKKLQVEKGAIAFTDVEFYFHSEKGVLHNFNLTIDGGQKVALVGPSGAGKSTITKLLLRLFDVKSGTIEIDGQNIAQVTQDSLRETISFVPQEPILFHRTLMENIRYGRLDATDAEVIEAAKQAHCHEFISQLPQGYETFVGERGIKLSGGERQRVAIARAILKNAPILVLDEATSSLDSESEALIQDALATLMEGKTVIVIAHRLSTIMKMDRIIVLQQGAIVADGTHDELLAEGGLYQKLWNIQAGGFLVET